MAELLPGAWIKTLKTLKTSKANSSSELLLPFWHHGIVSEISSETGVKVVHFTRPEGSGAGTERKVCETSLEGFLNGGSDAQLVDDEPAFAYEDIVKRARKHIGAKSDCLPTRKGEHFASWCFRGSSAFSRQIIAFGTGAGLVTMIFAVLSVSAFAAMSRSQSK